MDISHGCQVTWRDRGEVGEGSGVGGTRAGPPRSSLSMLSSFMARVRGGRARAAPPFPQPQEPCPQEAGRASLVAQWLRICLLMQGTRVRALVWEDPTCHGAAGPVSHNC